MSATSHRLDSVPTPVQAARTWFEANYSAESVSAVGHLRDGKASAVLYIPPCDPQVLNLLLTLVDGAYQEARK